MKIFDLALSYLKTYRLKFTKLQFLPLVLYRCETWSLALREEGKFSMFENKVLRIIFELKERFSSKRMEKITKLVASEFVFFTY